MGATEKVSITIGRDELRHAKKLAARLGLSLSTFITDAVRERLAEQERREAAKAVVASFPPEDRATAGEMAEMLLRWGGAGQPGAPAQGATSPGPQRTRPRAALSNATPPRASVIDGAHLRHGCADRPRAGAPPHAQGL
jgi:hypothetical protein